MRKSVSILYVLGALFIVGCASSVEVLRNPEKVKVVNPDSACNASINEESAKSANESNYWVVYKRKGKDGCISTSWKGLYYKPDKLNQDILDKCKKEEGIDCEILAHASAIKYTNAQQNEIKQRDDLISFLEEYGKGANVVSSIIKEWDELWDKQNGDFYIAIDKSNFKNNKSIVVECLDLKLKTRDLTPKESALLKFKANEFKSGFYK